MLFSPKATRAQPNEGEVNKKIAALARMQAEVLSAILRGAVQGSSTAALADIGRRTAEQAGVGLSFKGTAGFPDDISVSINHESMNGIPDAARVVKPGDLVKIGLGTHDDRRAFCTQHWTVAVGDATPADAKLMANVKACVAAGIERCVPGASVSSIVDALELTAGREGIFLSPNYVGHLIGAEPVMPPLLQKPRGLFGKEVVIEAGCVVSVFALGYPARPVEKIRDDGLTVYERNRWRSAVFSHLVLVDDAGPQVLTRDPQAAL